MNLTATLHFTVRIFGLPVKGRFQEVNLQGHFDPQHPQQTEMDVRAQVKSIDTGIAKRDQHLMEPKFFDADRYPVVQFVSSQVEQTNTGHYVAHGTLHIKGHSQAFDLPFSVREGPEYWHARGNTRLNRHQFGIGGLNMILGRWVQIDYDLAFLPPSDLSATTT